MKAWSGTAVAIVLLSLGAWTFLDGIAPMEPPATAVVVAASGLVVFGAKSVISRFRKP